MLHSTRLRAPGKALIQILIVVLFTLALTLALREAMAHFFTLKLDNRYWLRDYLGNVSCALLCLALTHEWRRALVLSITLISGFQLVNAGKLVVLGTPISPDDFINLRNLFLLWDGWLLAGTIAIVVIPVLVLLWLVRWKHWTVWTLLALSAATVFAAASQSEQLRVELDKRFGNSVWNQPENFRKRGLALHLVQESLRVASKVDDAPTLESIAPLQATFKHVPPQLPTEKKRNVHVLVLESFYDPNQLGPILVPEDPLPAEFHALWARTGYSTALAPVFGGYTANAEFEALCGFPVTRNAVFFEGWLRRQVPCLPAMLGGLGYKTVASHPNVPGFWNRNSAYNLMGFDKYYSKSDFDTTDSVGSFLLDHSFYRQVFEKPEITSDQPVFNYMLTYHGHLPYPNSEAYPDQIATPTDSSLLNGYLNHVYYKSRDLMQVLDELARTDPDALVVAFGDHLPYLGKNYGMHTNAGKMMPQREDFTPEMFEYLVSTPLIVINGREGPLQLGKLPLYRIPSLILQLLGAENTSIVDWTSNPAGKTVRPVYGMHFYLTDGQSVVCTTEQQNNEGCQETSDWLSTIETLSADLFYGGQHSLSAPR